MLSTAGGLRRVLPLNVQFSGKWKLTVLRKHPVETRNQQGTEKFHLANLCRCSCVLYPLPEQIFSAARTVRGRLFDVPEQGLAKTDSRDVIIRTYGLLGHRMVLWGKVKCADSAVFHDESFAPPMQRNKHTQTMTFGIISSIVV